MWYKKAMRLIEIDTGIMIEAPNELRPDQTVLSAMAKVALRTAREVLGLESLQELKMRGGGITIASEHSSSPNQASVRVDFNEKCVIVKLSQEAYPYGVQTFNEDVFRATAEGVTLLEARLQNPELVADPMMKDAMIEIAGTTSINLMQSVIDEAGIPVTLENRGRRRIHPHQ